MITYIVAISCYNLNSYGRFNYHHELDNVELDSVEEVERYIMDCKNHFKNFKGDYPNTDCLVFSLDTIKDYLLDNSEILGAIACINGEFIEDIDSLHII